MIWQLKFQASWVGEQDKTVFYLKRTLCQHVVTGCFFKVRRDLVALEERLQCHRSFYRKLEQCSSLKFEELSTPTSSDYSP